MRIFLLRQSQPASAPEPGPAADLAALRVPAPASQAAAAAVAWLPGGRRLPGCQPECAAAPLASLRLAPALPSQAQSQLQLETCLGTQARLARPSHCRVMPTASDQMISCRSFESQLPSGSATVVTQVPPLPPASVLQIQVHLSV
eukprot:939536-Rhodomonas_salina.2